MSSTRVFVNQLLTQVPELNETHRQHVEDNDTLLPHVFMGEVTRFVVRLSHSDAGTEILLRILRLMDLGIQSVDEDVRELIGVSFVENLCGEQMAIAKLLPLAGDRLRHELKTVCGP